MQNFEGRPQIDVNSREWAEIERWAHKERDALRKLNDKTSLGIEQTQYIRGRISVLSELVNLREEIHKAAIKAANRGQ